MISNGNFHPILMALAIDAAAAGARPCRPAVGPTDGPAVGPSGIRPGGVHTRGLRAARAAKIMPLRAGAEPRGRRNCARWRTQRRSTSGRSMWVSRTIRRTRRWQSGEPMEALGVAGGILTVELLTATAVVGWRDEYPGRRTAPRDSGRARCRRGGTRSARSRGVRRESPIRLCEACCSDSCSRRPGWTRSPESSRLETRRRARVAVRARTGSSHRRIVLVAAVAAFTANLDPHRHARASVGGPRLRDEPIGARLDPDRLCAPYAVSILAVGRLGDGFGHRRVLIGGASCSGSARSCRRQRPHTRRCLRVECYRGSAAVRCSRSVWPSSRPTSAAPRGVEHLESTSPRAPGPRSSGRSSAGC